MKHAPQLGLGILVGLLCSACGVKGKPLPPLDPPSIGRGEPVFTEATQDIQLKKKAPIKIKDDWDEPKDFPNEMPEDKSERSQ